MKRALEGYLRWGFVYLLNMQIFLRKFGINFLMNLLYTLGVIGISSLAAGSCCRRERRWVRSSPLAGLNRMNSPWRDLMNWFRDLTNAGTKYRLIVEQLDNGAPAPAERPLSG